MVEKLYIWFGFYFKRVTTSWTTLVRYYRDEFFSSDFYPYLFVWWENMKYGVLRVSRISFPNVSVRSSYVKHYSQAASILRKTRKDIGFDVLYYKYNYCTWFNYEMGQAVCRKIIVYIMFQPHSVIKTTIFL